ncbi:MAG: hypothetical protein C0172_03600 [Caldisphaera sp.]|jgi:hypothetical protein|uniref:DUF2067 domain-containing protein n=1 Tax=Caldisphaera sp. TaxID=2060322 RepID=UPI000CACA5A4|nr:MAG: hypothetical protein C0172_03600 [Caldisphaera sp.]
MKNIKKKLVFSLKEGYDAETIFKKINEIISSQEALIRIEDNKLIIIFFVTPRDINYIKSKIKEILSFESNKGKVNGFKYNIGDINPSGGRDFLDILVFILSKQGYKTEIDDGFIITTANKEKVISLAKDLERNLKEISDKNYSNAVKKVLACYLTIYKKDISEADHFIKEGLNLGILEENKNKIYTKYSWKETYEMLGKV